MVQSEAPGAAQSLLALLVELDRHQHACQAQEQSDFSAGPRLKKLVAASRTEQLARFLRLQSSSGAVSRGTSSPQAGSSGTAASCRGAAKRYLHIGGSRPQSPGGWCLKRVQHQLPLCYVP